MFINEKFTNTRVIMIIYELRYGAHTSNAHAEQKTQNEVKNERLAFSADSIHSFFQNSECIAREILITVR